MKIYSFITSSEINSKHINFFQNKPVICFCINLLEFFESFINSIIDCDRGKLNFDICFAVPKIVKCVKFASLEYLTVYWYSPVEGNIMPIFTLSFEEREKITKQLEFIYKKLKIFISKNLNNSNNKIAAYAQFLSLITLPNNLDNLFVVNNRLIITNWGLVPNVIMKRDEQNNNYENDSLETWKNLIIKLSKNDDQFKKQCLLNSKSKLHKEVTWEKWLVLIVVILGAISWYQASKYSYSLKRNLSPHKIYNELSTPDDSDIEDINELLPLEEENNVNIMSSETDKVLENSSEQTKVFYNSNK